MGLICDAICWDHTYASIILYGLFEDSHVPPKLAFSEPEVSPLRVLGPYELVDEVGVIGLKKLFRYSIRLPSVPEPVNEYLSACFSEIFQAGANCAWFAFEGGFDFDLLLTAESANQVYGFCIAGGMPSFATDENIQSLKWSTRVAEFRVHALEK